MATAMKQVWDDATMIATPFWVFGYGSLMWNPGFEFLEQRTATLHGYHRDLCIYSIRYRGTHDVPGLVMGLDRGGSCRGRAYRVPDDQAEAVRTYLFDREQIHGVYIPRTLKTRLDDGRTVSSYVFISKTDHDQYAGKLTADEAARLVIQGFGEKGPCTEYVENTLDHLADMGIHDARLHRILQAVKRQT